QEEGIAFYDLHDAVAGAMPPGKSQDYEIALDGHPNERGAKLIEEAAWPILERRLGR
ncbi:MAG: hypothetical protein JSR24_06395, partial [Proteobacteria bacterium]|nr:hypothetical protein [Pseudomonadota bacterium]